MSLRQRRDPELAELRYLACAVAPLVEIRVCSTFLRNVSWVSANTTVNKLERSKHCVCSASETVHSARTTSHSCRNGWRYLKYWSTSCTPGDDDSLYDGYRYDLLWVVDVLISHTMSWRVSFAAPTICILAVYNANASVCILCELVCFER